MMKKADRMFLVMGCCMFILFSSAMAADNQPPTADAGADQEVEEGTIVTLDGSASSDPDDGIASYNWLQTSGPEVTFSNPGSVQPSFTPDVGIEGASFTFQLTVTDNSGATHSDTCVVTASWVNEPPFAEAGPNQTAAEGVLVTLDASGSSDSDDGIASFLWVQTSGPDIALSDPTALQPTFTPGEGMNGASFTFQLTVTDNGDQQSTDICTVNISRTNLPPVADAGPDQTVDEGVTVMLDGSESSDPDDGIAYFQWVQIAGSEVTLSNASAVQPTFTPDVGIQGASFTFQLTVTDNGSLQSADTCVVNVSWVNEPPLANAGPDIDGSIGASVSLDGSASSDADDGIASYLWTQTGGPEVMLSDSGAIQPTFVPDVGMNGASLTFELTVSDRGGLQATDTCIVKVSLSNLAPIADAGPDQTVDEDVSVTLDGSASSDPDDGIASFQWVQIAGPAVTLLNPNAVQTAFTPDVALKGASLTFQITVTDNGGLQAADTCVVNVSWVNAAPTADAGPDQAANEWATVTLDASNSSDPDDGIEYYWWRQIEGPGVGLSDAGSAQPHFMAPDVNPEGAALTFLLTVIDKGGLQDTDTCIVNVSAFNVSPIANAGADQNVEEAAEVMLDGSNSSDPDDGIASYQWVQTAGAAVTLSDPAAVQPGFVPDVGSEGGSFTFQLTVTDNGGLQATDTCIVNVSWVNAPPVAEAGENQTVDEGATVTLDGSASADPDDNVGYYLWEQIEGPGVTLSSSMQIQPTFTAPEVRPEGASLIFQLTVEDTGGLRAVDTCIVNVSAFNLSPTANAGSDQFVAEGTAVTLDGSQSSDPDDGVALYQWIQIAGRQVTFSDPAAVQPTFIPDVDMGGSLLVFQLTVTDNGGLKGSDTCMVNVSWVNESPVADAGQDQTQPEDITLITLDGSASTDSDDGIASYQWVQVAGPVVALSDPAAIQPTFTPPDVGPEEADLIFELSVTDVNGLQSTDACTVHVTWLKTPPTADAGPMQTVGEGVEVMLDGSNSSDPDDGIGSYQWVQTAGTQIALSDPAAIQPTFITPEVNPNGESLVFQLTVTDNSGAKDADTCIVNVSWQNTAPVANAGVDQDMGEREVTWLDGSNSSDPDNGIAYYRWTQIAGPAVELSDQNIPGPSFVTPDVSATGASMTFQLTVTDNGGLQSADTCIVNVSWLNKTPITDAGPDQTVDEGDVVTLNGSNSLDPDDGIASYQWIQTEGPPVGFSDSTIVETTFTAPDVGSGGASLAFQLTVTDNGGLQSVDTCIVNVSWVDLPPVADAGADQVAYEGVVVMLDGSASSDPDDEIVSYLWSQTGGPQVNLSDPGAVYPAFTAPEVGSDGAPVTFQLTVTDGAGLRDTDDLIVNILWANSPPVSHAGSDQAAEEGSTVTLDGSGASDSDSLVTAYLWAQIEGPPVSLSDPTDIRPTLVPRPVDPGETDILRFQLTVTDEGGLQHSDSVSVWVSDNGITDFPEQVLAFRAFSWEPMGIEVSDGGLTYLVPLDPDSISNKNNQPGNLDYGLTDMKIRTVTGGTVTVTITLLSPLGSDIKWFHHSADKGWKEYKNVEFSSERDQVTLTFTDGGAGDDDGAANGVIENTSGPGTKPDDGGDGGSDTVCFISTSAQGMTPSFGICFALIVLGISVLGLCHKDAGR